MARLYLKNPNQKDAYSSPWSKKEAIMIRVWAFVWIFFIKWLPKPLFRLHILALKIFGCKITGRPFIDPSAKIYAPWLLTIGDHSCLAQNSEVYNLGPIFIGERATVAQYVYLCNGSHDFSDKRSPLLVGEMFIGDDVFIGAKAMVLPGLKVCKGAIIGGGSVLTKDAEPWGIYAGNPAKFIKKRILKDA